MQIENKVEKGSIAVFKDSSFPKSKGTSSPYYLAELLKEAGYSVTFLKANELTEQDILNKSNFDLLVLPDGVFYPAKGKLALVNYLKSGGAFFSSGGYAFDKLLELRNGEWQEIDVSVDAVQQNPTFAEKRINTRYGKPGDTLSLRSEQIGIFDPSYLLERVNYIETAPNQNILKEKIKLKVIFKGFAATAMTGSNSPVFPDVFARWIPLVNGYDKYERLVGCIGAMVLNYTGTYAKAAWAFFGVNNSDLFSKERQSMNQVFLKTVDFLINRTFLHELKTDYACYRQKEAVNLSVNVSNNGNYPVKARIEFLVDSTEIYQTDIELQPEETQQIQTVWKSEKFKSDFYRVNTVLTVNGVKLDELETGFVVWHDSIISDGFPVNLKDNYFCYGEKPVFLSGTNQTGMMFYADDENPLVWNRDFSKMRDNGINILRILHFSPFSEGGYQGKPSNRPLGLKVRPKKLIRQTDAIVQLAQKHKIVLFLTLHDWMDVELSEQELQVQKEWNEFWVKRYAEVPGIIFDIQNEPSVKLSDSSDFKREFNRYLKEKYNTTERLREIWDNNSSEESLGEVDVKEGSSEWRDMRTFDVNYFKVLTLNRWVKKNAEGIHAGYSDALLTVGYLPWMHPADKILGTEFVDFSNMHYYGSIANFPLEFKLIDRRFEGKSFSLGEFGAQEAHDARTHGIIGERTDESIARFMAIGHYALGLGASFVANWNWKDFNACIFPWGLNYSHNLVSKPWLKAYRTQSLFFRLFEPKYSEPEVYFLVPDNNRLGAKYSKLNKSILNGIELLLGCHVNFNVINEYHIDKLPENVKALILPITYCPKDETFDRVLQFVREGGKLYFSGDIAWDEFRRRNRTERLEQLGLPDLNPHEPFKTLEESFSQEPVTKDVGLGKIFFVSYPLELYPDRGDKTLYKMFLDFAEVKRIAVEPDNPEIHMFSLLMQNGDMAYIFYNGDTSTEFQKVKLLETPKPIELTLRQNHPGFVLISEDGEIKAIEAEGEVSVNDRVVVKGNSHFMIASLDDADIQESDELLFLPLEVGSIELYNQGNEELIANFGEIVGGEWECLEKFQINASEGRFILSVDENRSLNIVLLANRRQIDTTVEKINRLLLLKEKP